MANSVANGMRHQGNSIGEAGLAVPSRACKGLHGSPIVVQSRLIDGGATTLRLIECGATAFRLSNILCRFSEQMFSH